MTTPPPTPTLRRPPALAVLLPVAAALAAYASSLNGGWIFDDNAVFVEGSAMDHGDWWEVAFGEAHTPLANRPFTCFTFAVNPPIAGSDATGLRVGNLLLHVINVLLLLGVVRRCLLAPNLAGRFTVAHATRLAVAVATIWACHPLGSDAVAYITQRSALLMSGALLAASYCVLRHAETPLRRWRVLTVVALALGMASKEEFVSAPILIVLFERAFLLPDWGSLRSRSGFYAALAATWLVLAFCVALGPSNTTVGYGAIQKVTAFEWLMTQSGVILHYIQMAVWPHPMRGAYAWPIERDFGDALLPLLLVTALFAATVWSWRRWPWLAWLWSMFFLLLGPTSSVMPIVTEVVAERRVYLAMLAVVVPVVLAADRWLPPIAARGLFAVAVVAAIFATRAHGEVLGDAKVFWKTAYAKNDMTNGSLVSAIILGAYAQIVHDEGNMPEALALLERGMKCEAKMERVPLTYGEYLREVGRLDEAERVLRDLLAENPDVGPANGVLAFILVTRHEADLVAGKVDANDPRLAEAVDRSQRAYEFDNQPSFLNTLGMAYTRQGRWVEAERALRDALRLEADFVDAKKSLGALLCFTDRMPEGLAMLRQVADQKPKDVGLRLSLAHGYLQAGDRTSAIVMLRQVLDLEPGHQAAQQMLQELGAAR